MPKLTAPPLPPGPRQTLSLELHTLHRRAGWPSVRDLSRALGAGVASPSRIHDAFTKPRLPDWGLLDVLVTALAKKIPRADPAAEVERFHALWDAASEDQPAPVDSSSAGAERDIPPPPPLTVPPPAIPPPLENGRQTSDLDGLAADLAAGRLTAAQIEKALRTIDLAGGRLTTAQIEKALRTMISRHGAVQGGEQDEDSARVAELRFTRLSADEIADVMRALRTPLGLGLDTTELEEERDRAVRQALREREASWQSLERDWDTDSEEEALRERAASWLSLERGSADDLPERVPMPLMDHLPPSSPEPGEKGRIVRLFEFIRGDGKDSEDDALNLQRRQSLDFLRRMKSLSDLLDATERSMETRRGRAGSRYREDQAAFDRIEELARLRMQARQVSEKFEAATLADDGDAMIRSLASELSRIESSALKLRHSDLPPTSI
ncbi:hypothetical protein [Streptomyces sp. NPDC004266]|uniref:hypothetical protein n=1 Tax=Streptomyces sp. NPDC004266 TaxID=3364693 RepID=UPI0036884259